MAINNSLYQKNSNISLVARELYLSKGLSRIELAKRLSFYRSTVTNISSYLIDEGVVVEGKALDSHSQGGRKAIELRINPSFGCAFGFDLQPSHYRAVIVSFNGDVLYQDKGSLGSISLEEMAILLVYKGKQVQEELRIPLLGISYSIPGIIDSLNGVVISSEPFKANNLKIKELVQSKFKVPVFVENDANAASWFDLYSNNSLGEGSALSIVGEYHEEALRNKNVTGSGVGVGIIIKGEVFHGSHNAAGELVTLSWRRGDKNQSGISNEKLSNIIFDKEVWKLWIKDIFSSLTPIVAVMDFEKIILHGPVFKESDEVVKLLNAECSSFIGILEKTGCTLEFDASDETICAKGAALHFLHYLYTVPELSNEHELSWDRVITLRKAQSFN